MPKRPFSNAKIEFLFNPAEDNHDEIKYFIENMNEIIEEWVSNWNDKVHIQLEEFHTTDLSGFHIYYDENDCPRYPHIIWEFHTIMTVAQFKKMAVDLNRMIINRQLFREVSIYAWSTLDQDTAYFDLSCMKPVRESDLMWN